ncbi:hypothetical protein [Sphingomonas sp. Leaf343]|uniref:hypothetical protein n=1 Tax=Sphingomonas sp. Leaf343 TaxID=1736345 RepID=UPI0007018E6A|nr:hypothetical protein [Sphingomonas sp. Leaf343]KQR83153.1 hypothetical protein ASG07_09290 [Sphingomonas sp. Leaf343]
MQAVRFGILILAGGLVVAATKPPQTSWGKPGVSIDQYRIDSFECAKTGYFADVRDTQQAKDAIRVLETADREINNGDELDPNARVLRMRALRPDARVREVGKVLTNVVERCLSDRGYRRFALTRAQAKSLGKLPAGSLNRQLYLHSLASDPRVVAEQVVG